MSVSSRSAGSMGPCFQTQAGFLPLQALLASAFRVYGRARSVSLFRGFESSVGGLLPLHAPNVTKVALQVMSRARIQSSTRLC